MMRSQKKLVFIYEPGHIGELERYFLQKPELKNESIVVSLDKEVEFLLEEANIPFHSGSSYQTDISLKLRLRAEEWAQGIFRDSRWSFFQYRQVPFTKVFFPAFLGHIQKVLYFTNFISNILEAHIGIEHIIIFPSLVVVSASTGYLARREADLAVECLKMVAESRGQSIIIPKVTPTYERKAKFAALVFSLKRLIFILVLSVWNIFMRIVRSSGKPRILVSDYWRHIAPILPEITEGEIIMFDRGEAMNSGIINMWQYRMRFLHFYEHLFILRYRSKRSQTRHSFLSIWEQATSDKAYLSDYVVCGVSVRPLLLGVLGDMIKQSVTHTINEVDGAYALLNDINPDVVLLRASISSQTHFATLAFVGRALGIPALDLQHGIEYNGPGSGGKRHATEYIGVYGSLVQKELEQLGFSHEVLPLIGSPRFDMYAGAHEIAGVRSPQSLKAAFRVLCIAPTYSFGEDFDSYAVSNYFSAIASAVRKLAGTTLIIKLRSGYRRESFYRDVIKRACQGVSYLIVQDEPLIGLFRKSDVVISYYSTAVLEALQCVKPTIVFGLLTMEAEAMRFHFSLHAKAGAVIIAEDGRELSGALSYLRNNPSAQEEMSHAARVFMELNYSFDGGAAKRVAEFIKKFTSDTRR